MDSIQLESTTEALKIRIDDLQVAHNSLSTRGDRIYIDIPNGAIERRLEPEDKTIKLIEVTSGRKPRISVKLRHGRKKTIAIANASTIENLHGGVVLHIPRWPIASSLEAEQPKKVAAAITTKEEQQAKDNLGGAEELSDKTQTQPTHAIENEIKNNSQNAMAATNQAGQEEAGATKPQEQNESTPFGLVLGLLMILGGAAFAAWRLKQKSSDLQDTEELRIVASKQLGGKAKVVWLSVAGREMVVSVGEAGTQLLSEWPQDSDDAAAIEAEAKETVAGSTSGTARLSLPLAIQTPWGKNKASRIAPTLIDSDMKPAKKQPNSTAKTLCDVPEVYDFRSTLKAAGWKSSKDKDNDNDKPEDVFQKSTPTIVESPAIAGLLRLRDQAPSINMEVATEDAEADAEWAREILKAARESVRRAD
jgi:flagellar biogenesis protein FliO